MSMTATTNHLWQRLQGNYIFFIAEIGKNFIQTEEAQSREQYLKNAKKLVDQAKDAGADAVKFQTHNYEDEQMPINVVAAHFSGADRYSWVKRNTEITGGTFWADLKNYCDDVGIIFFSTPMSRGAAKILQKIEVPLWKVGSGDILDFVMLDYLRRTYKPIIISAGMSTQAELDKALGFIREKNEKVALLHCVSKYPCPVKELHVGTVSRFKNIYNMPVGFSDHSLGYEGVLQAVKCGASIIEKHFSLSRELWGSDHKVSMTPVEFAQMVNHVRQGMEDIELDEMILGRESGDLVDRDSEFRPLFRKSLVAGRDINEGEVITADMVYAMRPQAHIGGFPSEQLMAVVGQKAKCHIKKYDVITEGIIMKSEKVRDKVRIN